MVQLTVRGKITFKGGAPDKLPDGSRLQVQFQDVSLADAPSTTLGTFTLDIKDYTPGVPLKYSITTEKPRPVSVIYSVSAVINVGWAAQEGGNEWIRQGDYLNDTTHPVDITDGQNEYEKDIEVVHYRH